MSKLFDTVKDKCKDMGLSEKHLKDLTEALGGGLTEDSTEEEVNAVVEQIVKIAGYSQGELTRKLQQKKTPKKKPTKAANTDGDDDPDDPDDSDEGKTEVEKAINALRKEMQETLRQEREERKAERDREARSASIKAAMDKYKIPEKQRRFIQNVPDDVEDVDKYISEYAQEIVTDGLPGDESGQRKVPTQKETEDTGKSWFQRLSGKKENKD